MVNCHIGRQGRSPPPPARPTMSMGLIRPSPRPLHLTKKARCRCGHLTVHRLSHAGPVSGCRAVRVACLLAEEYGCSLLVLMAFG